MTKELEEAKAEAMAALAGTKAGSQWRKISDKGLRTLLSAVDGDGWRIPGEMPTRAEVIAMCQAHDAEQSAQMGEPSPWVVNADDIDPDWVEDRIAAMRCALAAPPVPEGGE